MLKLLNIPSAFRQESEAIFPLFSLPNRILTLSFPFFAPEMHVTLLNYLFTLQPHFYTKCR